MTNPPRFHKGDIVAPKHNKVYGYRQMTEAEVDAWYASKNAQAPHDEAGEPWVCSKQTAVTLTGPVTVTVGACRYQAGWVTKGGGCKVVTQDGQILTVPRRDLILL
jgi:hypothetical protein